jgi:hypothetical protein
MMAMGPGLHQAKERPKSALLVVVHSGSEEAA